MRRRVRQMSPRQLEQVLTADIKKLCSQLAWLESSDGRNRTGDWVPVATSNVDDPSARAALADLERRKARQLRRSLERLRDRTLPEIEGRARLPDDEPRPSDRHRGADIGGGYSAERGDRKVRAAGRTDIQEALDAAHRRAARGETHGAG